MQTQIDIDDVLQPNRKRRARRAIAGFDYRTGEHIEKSAREWRDLRESIIADGGFAKWCHGEQWLFSKHRAWLYEIYYRDRADGV
jgi:hypothetical protein